MTTAAPVDDRLLAALAVTIQRCGHAVYADCDPLMVDPTTAYTVGFHAEERSSGYELAIIGMPPRAAARALNDVSDRLWSIPGAFLQPDMILLDVQGYTAKLRPADDSSFLVLSHALYEHKAPALQVLIADPNGFFPDDPAYSNGINGQRLL
ncbi:DUF4262 domain-containing protein [Streptomyces sp. 11x1]|uniref:DUF4262 domain-containing protein n=1 Tax=Streptomyces sp. 11x1 TaxID=3038642 RepID=UPI00292FAF1A|nr:DUF4262 domain-containing protein [Streptomyces sp. 11x1]WNZ14912.1 DUF4262 domain-containing protein [Streptomyces sp. 11x1]